MWTGSDDVAAFRGDGDYTHCLVVTAKFSQQIKMPHWLTVWRMS